MRLGERICALRDAGLSEQRSVQIGTEQMMNELRQTKIQGTLARNAFRDAMQNSTDRCGIQLR